MVPVINCCSADYSEQLKKLEQYINNLEKKLEETEELAKEASETVNNVHTNALKIYGEIVSLIIPDINIPKLKEVAELTANEVSRLTNIFKLKEVAELTANEVSHLTNISNLKEVAELTVMR